MRAFVVLASLAVLVSADVKHLYDAPYHGQSTVSHGSNFGLPLVHAAVEKHQNYAKPAVATTTQQFVQQPTTFVQHQPIVETTVNRFGSESVGSYPVNSNFDVISTTGSGNSGSTGFGGHSGSTGFTSGSSGFGGHSGSHSGAVNSGFGGAVNSGFGNSGFGGAYNDQTSYGHSHVTLVKQTAPIVSKNSYVFAAPEDKEEIQRDQTIVLPRPRQHYKVVFVKAPATTIVNSNSAAFGQQTQEKTLIYVLSDKKRIENNIDVPEIDQVKPQKPEVFFIKNNLPTQVVNSQIKYETVDAVNGAENGAHNGVPNKVSANAGNYQDEASNPQQAQIAQAIYQAVQQGGLESGVHTVDKLIAGGHSISGGSSSFGGQKSQDEQSGGFGQQILGQITQGFGTVVNSISQVNKGINSGVSTIGQQVNLQSDPIVQTTNTFTSGAVQPSLSSTHFVKEEQKPTTITFGSGNSGDKHTEQGYNY